MAYPGRTLLACWLAVVLTGTTVGHRHAAATAHTHGLGWAGLPGVPGPDDLPLDHRHFVLLGIELGPVSGTADGDVGAGARPAVGLLAANDTGPADALFSADFSLVLPLPLPAPSQTGTVIAVTTLAVPLSCSLVTHARSGVLRS